jgi:adenylate kinase
VTGTPGTGKTTFAELFSQELGVNHVDVGAIVKEKGLHEGYDQNHQSYILDDDKVNPQDELYLAECVDIGDSVDHAQRLPNRRFRAIPFQVVDELEPSMGPGGNVVDFHSCDLFPERWFDLVLVLRTNNTVLYDRLEKR